MTTETEAMELWRAANQAFWRRNEPAPAEAAAAIIATKLAERDALIPEAECMKQMRETAQDMGYADCLEALEALAEMRALIERADALLLRAYKSPHIQSGAATLVRDIEKHFALEADNAE